MGVLTERDSITGFVISNLLLEFLVSTFLLGTIIGRPSGPMIV
ncbi:hypothetical protein [Acinetobacter baumannii]|nr:hypothetical protein [Acinetobacter baumannii]